MLVDIKVFDKSFILKRLCLLLIFKDDDEINKYLIMKSNSSIIEYLFENV